MANPNSEPGSSSAALNTNSGNHHSYVDSLIDFVDMWFGKAPPPKPKPAIPQNVANPHNVGATSVFDVDGDGDVDMDDMIAAMDGDVEGETAESMIAEYKPIFVVSQISLCIVLWVAGALGATNGDVGQVFTSVGGLEFWFPGDTKLFVHKDCTNHAWEVWRWITYQWTHGSFTHITMNSILTLMFGIPLEGFHGHLRIIFIFNVGVVGGALSHMVSKTHDGGLVGMSAGCYALMGMRMADLVLNWFQNRWRKVYLLVLILLIIFDILVAQFAKPDDPTGHSAHLGGYVAGLIMGVLFVRNLKVSNWERYFQAIALAIGLALTIFCVAWTAQWAPRSIRDTTPWCWARQMYDPTIFGDKNWHCIRCADQTCIDTWQQLSQSVQERNKWVQSKIIEVSYKQCDENNLWKN